MFERLITLNSYIYIYNNNNKACGNVEMTVKVKRGNKKLSTGYVD